VGTMDQGVTRGLGLTVQPGTNTLHAIVNAGGGRRLATVDRLTAAVTLGPVLENDLTDIAFAPDGTLYGVLSNTTGDGGDLVIVNLADGSFTDTGISFGEGDGQSIAFRPGSRTLYHFYMIPQFGSAGVVSRVNLDTGERVVIAVYDFESDPKAIAFNLAGSRLCVFGIDPDGNDGMAFINPDTGDYVVAGVNDTTITGAAFVRTGTVDVNNNGRPDECDVGGGGGPPPPPPPNMGGGVVDQMGNFTGTARNNEGREIGKVVVTGAPPGSTFSFNVTEGDLGPEDAPGPGTGTFMGFFNGMGLGRTLIVTGNAPPGTFMVTLSITYTAMELAALGVTDPTGFGMYVLDTTAAPPTWNPAGMNGQGNSQPTGVVGDFGFFVNPDGSVTFWVVRDSLSNFAVGAVMPPAQEVRGACCLANGTCVVASAAACAGQNGTYQGDDTTCEQTNCPQPPPPEPTGACCLSGGTCQVLTAAACAGQGGTYQGNNTSCSPNPCPQPPRPCLLPPICGICLCGGGAPALMPLTILGLMGMRWRLRRRYLGR